MKMMSNGRISTIAEEVDFGGAKSESGIRKTLERPNGVYFLDQLLSPFQRQGFMKVDDEMFMLGQHKTGLQIHFQRTRIPGMAEKGLAIVGEPLETEPQELQKATPDFGE